MNPPVRIIRFARTDISEVHPSGGEIIARVYLNETAAPVGLVLRAAGFWAYRLVDGPSPVLESQLTRQDLERQISLFHLGEVPCAPAAHYTPEQPEFIAAI
jgi:hypothetical protein